MPITPDTKNWTWVLERACDECGFDAAEWFVEDVAHAVRTQGDIWTRLLAHRAVRQRPTDDQWSALEYGCHVRDVFRLFDRRLERMLNEDGVQFANWDQDVTAIDDRYDEQDPAVVAAELVAAADRLADRLGSVEGEQWQRTGARSDGALFTVHTFALYLIHDPVHHVHDAEVGLERLASA